MEQSFPNLVSDGYRETSMADDDYNCIAYAAGDMKRWWSHLPGYEWPATRSPKIESLVQVFAGLGYEVCDDLEVEDGYEKVALYARNGMWKHAARQDDSGKWVSKLGPDEDIEHTTPEGLTGSHYGEVHCIMRRPIP